MKKILGMTAFGLLITGLFTALAMLACGVLIYLAGSLGAFDSPLVRLTRLVTANDAAATATARAIDQGVTPENRAGIMAAAGHEFDVMDGSRTVTLAWYLIDSFAYNDPRHAYFDWKEDSETVVPAFDAMLGAYGITDRPDMARMLADEQRLGHAHTAIPVLLAHYAPVFERAGLVLLTLDADWDAYYFVVLPRAGLGAWQNTLLRDQNSKDKLFLSRIVASSADLTDPARLEQAVATALDGSGPAQPMPRFLPLQMLWR